MTLVENYNVIQTFATNRTDETLDVGVVASENSIHLTRRPQRIRT